MCRIEPDDRRVRVFVRRDDTYTGTRHSGLLDLDAADAIDAIAWP